jgi:predicted dehydrogenase
MVLPGFHPSRKAQLVALVSSDERKARRLAKKFGPADVFNYNTYAQCLQHPQVEAVYIATNNSTHAELAVQAAAAGKHVLCEKPIAMNYEEAKGMADAADKAGVRHMTAFTYRFVPAMRYLHHLIQRGDLGQPYHYRSCRLQDWGSRNLGWRQVKVLAATGELGDMLSHRIDFAQFLIAPIQRLVANMKQLIPTRGGQPSDLDDWVAVLAEFRGGATGVLESSKLASGRNESWRSLDWVELNGSEATFEFTTGKWNELLHGKVGGPGLAPLAVPREFWVWPGCPRDPAVGDPLVSFRYDQAFEFIDAIRSQRPCNPSFHEGARTQAVIDAAVRSTEKQAWVELPN